jgi:hypothetical protein
MWMMDWATFGKEFLSAFVMILMQALIPVLVAAVVAWIVRKVQEIKAARPDIVDKLEWVIPLFVAAAEQAKASGFIHDKKAYALEIAQKYLDERGWKIDLDILDALIESAVYEEFNKSKLQAAG